MKPFVAARKPLAGFARHHTLMLWLTLPLLVGASCGRPEPWDDLRPRVAAVEPHRIEFPGREWTRLSHPAAAGWNMAKLEEAHRLWETNSGTSAVMVVHRGAVVAAWGPTARPMEVRSIRKSLLSALYGIHLAAGELALGQTLGELGVDDSTPLSPGERQARIADLLTSRSGVYLPAAKETSANRKRRPERGSHPPGTFFYYNNWDFNVLGSILNRAIGGDLLRDFRTRIAQPLGMEDFHLADQTYEHDAVSRHPAYWFELSARDLARFGLLYLAGGRWGGTEIVPADWVRGSTGSRVTQAKGGADYGDLWWVMPRRPDRPAGGGYFYADGAGFLWVVPEHELVVVHLTETAPNLGLRHALGWMPDEDQVWRLFERIVQAAPAAG